MNQWWVVPGDAGGISELRRVDVPAPGPAQVQIKIEAAAINRGELLARPMMTIANAAARPRPSGIEYSGTVAEVGSGVERWSVGQRVMGRGSGCHAEYTVEAADGVMAIPDGLSFEEAATIPNVFVTAHDALVTNACLQPGNSVLITAGSSGVGTAAIQIARRMGAARVIATSRSTKKSASLRQLGATATVDTSEASWEQSLVKEHGEIDIVIDQVGGSHFSPCLRTLAVQGKYVSVGRTGGSESTIDLDLVARKRLTLIGVTFRSRTGDEALTCSRRFADDLLSGFEDGSLRPVLDRSFPLSDLPAAHEYMRSERQIGKIVLVA
jgi:NADPH:quinone reductase-like Zn-dependent oxidoreductase